MLLYIRSHFFQIFTQSIDAIDVTRVTLSHLNSMNAIESQELNVECRMSNVDKVNSFDGAYLWSFSGHLNYQFAHFQAWPR